MPRSRGLAIAALVATSAMFADTPLQKEYGIERTAPGVLKKLHYSVYRAKDLTGAVALWESMRDPGDRACELAAFCTITKTGTVVEQDQYVVAFETPASQKEVDAVLAALPEKKETSLPAILTFLPREGMVPGSARYVLGPVSLSAFASQLASADPGFSEGAEAQVAEYNLNGAPARLALFYYPTPEMARLRSIRFKQLGNVIVKRSGVLVAIVFGGATQDQADTLLSRVQYEARITWNDTPPPPPIKPLYRLLVNILYMCIVLASLCLVAGLMYGGMRIYRRRFGELESEEAMTTLQLR